MTLYCGTCKGWTPHGIRPRKAIRYHCGAITFDPQDKGFTPVVKIQKRTVDSTQNQEGPTKGEKGGEDDDEREDHP
jgi:hypothetical protein